ncbi:MAG: ribonuclease D [Alphaproteobacteria bacterium]|nr:ribonuclease D [Alphaproteobacteria bacterium]
MNKDIYYISTQEELEIACAELSSCPILAIDTEFVREKTYWAKLCLIQISNGKKNYCIDPLLNSLDLTAVFSLMKKQDILKIFHASRQDLEIFYHLGNFIPSPVFDTQIAAQVLGYGESISYQNLVQGILEVKIQKEMRYTDWEKRPLLEKQMEYAANDVKYLFDIYPKIKELLEQENRLSWIEEEQKGQQDVSLYEVDSWKVWKKIKVHTHNVDALKRLKLLAFWREEQAKQRDVPRRSFLKDDLLLEWALFNPKTEKDFARLRNANASFYKNKDVQALLSFLENEIDSLSFKKDEFDAYLTVAEMKTKGQEEAEEALKFLLKIISEKQKVAPKILCSTKELEALSFGKEEDLSCLKGWRFDIFGKQALLLLQGKIVFYFNPEKQEMEIKEV